MDLVLSFLIELAIFFFAGYVFVYGGLRLTLLATNVSSVMRIPYRFLYSILPISGVFILAARILKNIQLYQEYHNKKGD